MEFVTLHEDEYDKYVSSHKFGGFLQSTTIAKRRQAAGWRVQLVGVRNKQGRIVAAAMLTSRIAFRRLALFECVQGPVLNYDNPELVAFFFDELRRFLRHHGAIRLRVSPPITLNRRDQNFNIVDTKSSSVKYIAQLEKQGLVRLPDETVDGDPLAQRWYAVKDLTKYQSAKELAGSFDAWTQQVIRQSLQSGVTVASLPIDQLDEFYDVLEHEGARRKAALHDKQYYRDLAQKYGDDVQFCVAQLDLDEYEASVIKQLGEATTAFALINPKNKNEKKLAERRAANNTKKVCQLRLRNIQHLRAQGKSSAVIAAAVFVRYGDELVNVVSRSYEQYVSFNAPYVLQWYGQLYALKYGVKRFNFCEANGNFNGQPKQQGTYLFRKHLGAVVEERIGHFEMYPYAHYSNLVVLNDSDRRVKQFRSRSNTVPIVFDRSPRLFADRSVARGTSLA